MGKQNNSKTNSLQNTSKSQNNLSVIGVDNPVINSSDPYDYDTIILKNNQDILTNVQKLLKELGYDLGTSGPNKDGVDGNWGDKTAKALRHAYDNGYYYYDGKIDKVKSFGTIVNEGINFLTTPRKWINKQINNLGVKSGNEAIRGIASFITGLNGTWRDALRARANNYINEKFPGWIEEKAIGHTANGTPVWTVDKEFGIARYYDENGNLVISSPVATGLIEGNKSVEGDNKTPTGTYILSRPEKGASKSGGEMSFGPYFYRTNHTNNNNKASGVGLHGTGFQWMNGTNRSHGCMRIDNNDIREFYNTAPNHGANTKIVISE